MNILQSNQQWTIFVGLVVTATGEILAAVEPFAEAMVGTGRRLDANK